MEGRLFCDFLHQIGQFYAAALKSKLAVNAAIAECWRDCPLVCVTVYVTHSVTCQLGLIVSCLSFHAESDPTFSVSVWWRKSSSLCFVFLFMLMEFIAYDNDDFNDLYRITDSSLIFIRLA